MVYGTETWNVNTAEEGILRKRERAMNIQKMCGVKISDRKNINEFMKMLEESVEEGINKSGLR